MVTYEEFSGMWNSCWNQMRDREIEEINKLGKEKIDYTKVGENFYATIILNNGNVIYASSYKFNYPNVIFMRKELVIAAINMSDIKMVL